MSNAEERYVQAITDLTASERAYGTAESNLIKARREKRDAEIAFYKEKFPTREDVAEYFRS